MTDLFSADLYYLKLDVDIDKLDDAITNAYKTLLRRNENSENMTRMFYHLYIIVANRFEDKGYNVSQLFHHFLEQLGKLEEDGLFDPRQSIGLDNSEGIALNMIISQLALRVKDIKFKKEDN